MLCALLEDSLARCKIAPSLIGIKKQPPRRLRKAARAADDGFTSTSAGLGLSLGAGVGLGLAGDLGLASARGFFLGAAALLGFDLATNSSSSSSSWVIVRMESAAVAEI